MKVILSMLIEQNIRSVIVNLETFFLEQCLRPVDSLGQKGGGSLSPVDSLQQAFFFVQEAQQACKSDACTLVSVAIGCIMCTSMYSVRDLERIIE